jgi:hypothetical protein
MQRRRLRLPSPAIVIAMVALSLVLGGTAIAAGTSTPLSKKQVTKLVKKLAPKLSVKHAKSATNATNAVNATNAANLGSHPATYYAHAGHEAVHFVGATGEPAFENGWTNYSANPGWSQAGFWKDAFGVVHLEGTLTAGTSGAPAFTLPAADRPATNLFVPVANGTFAYIMSTGEVEPFATGDVGIDGLSFLAGPSTAAAKPHASAHLPGS